MIGWGKIWIPQRKRNKECIPVNEMEENETTAIQDKWRRSKEWWTEKMRQGRRWISQQANEDKRESRIIEEKKKGEGTNSAQGLELWNNNVQRGLLGVRNQCVRQMKLNPDIWSLDFLRKSWRILSRLRKKRRGAKTVRLILSLQT